MNIECPVLEKEYADNNLSGKYKQQIIDLILGIQNNEAKINLSLEEQPDLLDITTCYEKDGGEFWLAVEGDTLIGTLALMNKGNGNAVLKRALSERTIENKVFLASFMRRFRSSQRSRD